MQKWVYTACYSPDVPLSMHKVLHSNTKLPTSYIALVLIVKIPDQHKIEAAFTPMHTAPTCHSPFMHADTA